MLYTYKIGALEREQKQKEQTKKEKEAVYDEYKELLTIYRNKIVRHIFME